jgi:pimeloyl-ACP methyl ester carboxylesterase
MKTTTRGAPLYKSAEARTKLLGLYEEALERWPQATGCRLERLRVGTAAGGTAIFAFGPAITGVARGATEIHGAPTNGAPLVLLHGTLSNSATWMGDAAVLARGRRVYAVDIPGEPGLSEERPLAWAPEAVSGWLTEVVKGLDLGEHAILGLSIGAWIALAYAIGRPAGLTTIALLCPGGIGRTRKSFLFKAILAGMQGKRGMDGITRSLFGALEPPEGAFEVSALFAESTNPRLEEPRLFTDEELARIEVPVFLAVGSRDVMLHAKETAERLGRIKSDAEIHLLQGAGHALVGQGELVKSFLDRHPQAV